MKQATLHKVEWFEFELKAGMRVTVDGNTISRRLSEGDEFSTFRLESQHFACGIACEVEVTSKKLRYKPSLSVRVKITIVKDGEPNESFGAWLWL